MSLNIDNNSSIQSIQNPVQSTGTNSQTTLLQDTVVVNGNTANSNAHSMNTEQNVETKRTVTKNNLLSHLKSLINDIITKLKNLFSNTSTTLQENVQKQTPLNSLQTTPSNPQDQGISELKKGLEELRSHLNIANVKHLSLDQIIQILKHSDIDQKTEELLSCLTTTIDSTNNQTLKDELSNLKKEIEQLHEEFLIKLNDQMSEQVIQKYENRSLKN